MEEGEEEKERGGMGTTYPYPSCQDESAKRSLEGERKEECVYLGTEGSVVK
jgi:hypothetical protein